MVELKVFDESGDFEPFQQKQFVQKYSAFTKGEKQKLVEFIRKKCAKSKIEATTTKSETLEVMIENLLA